MALTFRNVVNPSETLFSDPFSSGKKERVCGHRQPRKDHRNIIESIDSSMLDRGVTRARAVMSRWRDDLCARRHWIPILFLCFTCTRELRSGEKVLRPWSHGNEKQEKQCVEQLDWPPLPHLSALFQFHLNASQGTNKNDLSLLYANTWIWYFLCGFQLPCTRT